MHTFDFFFLLLLPLPLLSLTLLSPHTIPVATLSSVPYSLRFRLAFQKNDQEIEWLRVRVDGKEVGNMSAWGEDGGRRVEGEIAGLLSGGTGKSVRVVEVWGVKGREKGYAGRRGMGESSNGKEELSVSVLWAEEEGSAGRRRRRRESSIESEEVDPSMLWDERDELRMLDDWGNAVGGEEEDVSGIMGTLIKRKDGINDDRGLTSTEESSKKMSVVSSTRNNRLPINSSPLRRSAADNTTTLTTNDAIISNATALITVWTIPSWLTILPLLLTVVVAVTTKNVLPALFAGVWLASFFVFEFDVAQSFARVLDTIVLNSLMDSSHQTILLFAMIMGGFVQMINDSNGSIGLAHLMAKCATSPRSAQFVTLFFGFLIFFDDYASALIVSAAMAPVTDGYRVSRQKLCFLVDSGAAPIAALVPITSWTAFETTLLQVEIDKLLAKGFDIAALGYETSGFLALLRVLKFAYYSIYLLMFQFVLIATGREFGPMFAVEREARKNGVLAALAGKKGAPKELATNHDNKLNRNPPRCINATLPITVFIVYVVVAMVVLGTASVPSHEEVSVQNIFANVDSIMIMYYGSVIASLVCIVMYRFQYVWEEASEDTTTSLHRRPLMTMENAIDSFVKGFVNMTNMAIILVLAWSIGYAVNLMGAGDAIAVAFQGNIDSRMLPALIFVIAYIVSLATGTTWGTMALLYPICGEIIYILCGSDSERAYAAYSSCLEGAVAGAHISFISDTTILSAQACNCPLYEHIRTQLPYAVFIATISLVCGYIPFGMGWLTVGGTYAVGFICVLVGTLLLGAKPTGNRRDALSVGCEKLGHVVGWVFLKFRMACCGFKPIREECIGGDRVELGDDDNPFETVVAAQRSSSRVQPEEEQWQHQQRVDEAAIVI